MVAQHLIIQLWIGWCFVPIILPTKAYSAHKNINFLIITSANGKKTTLRWWDIYGCPTQFLPLNFSFNKNYNFLLSHFYLVPISLISVNRSFMKKNCPSDLWFIHKFFQLCPTITFVWLWKWYQLFYNLSSF